MSKKVIKSALVVVVIALSFPLSTGAQTSKTSHFTQTYPLDNHNVVREYNYPVTIASAVSQLGISQFYYNVTGQSVVSAFLKASNVYDFVIDNDTVFYCGKDNSGNGLIGFFNIQDLFFNGGRFYFSMDFPINNYLDEYNNQECYYAESFNKLVTYRDATGKRHIVCVGQTRGNGGARPCIVDLFSDPNGAYLAYNAGMIDDTNIASSMLDIERFCTTTYPALDDMTRPALCVDKGFTGLDLYNSKSQYVLFGKCSGNVYQHNVGIETSGSASHCQPQTTATFNEVDSRTSHSFNSEVLILGWRNNIKSLSAMIETGNIEIDCNQ